jgi:hypothetical protein
MSALVVQWEVFWKRGPFGRTRYEYRKVWTERARVIKRSGAGLDYVILLPIVRAIDLWVDEQATPAGSAKGTDDGCAAVGDDCVGHWFPMTQLKGLSQPTNNEHFIRAREVLAVATTAHMLKRGCRIEYVANSAASTFSGNRIVHFGSPPLTILHGRSYNTAKQEGSSFRTPLVYAYDRFVRTVAVRLSWSPLIMLKVSSEPILTDAASYTF